VLQRAGWALPGPFLYINLFLKKFYVAYAHAHLQRLVSAVKMATVFEEYTPEEQRSVVRFLCGQKDSMQRIFIKKSFLFTVASVCRLKLFTTGSRNSLKDVQKSQMTDQVEAEARKWLRQQSKHFYAASFDGLVK
jgi:hypothetical protein